MIVMLGVFFGLKSRAFRSSRVVLFGIIFSYADLASSKLLHRYFLISFEKGRGEAQPCSNRREQRKISTKYLLSGKSFSP
jgi:hypothetical protein